MNIVCLTPEPPVPPLTGGRERLCRMIGYLGRRHDIHLLTFAAREEEKRLTGLRRTVAKLTPIPYPARWGCFSDEMQQAVDQAMCCRPDAVHVQGLDMFRYAPVGPDTRFVLDLHDVPSLLEARLMKVTPASLASIWHPLRLARVRRREAAAIRWASAVIVVSERDRMTLMAAHADYAPEIVVIPNGVDLNYWTPSDIAPHPDTVLFPGALNWTPNVDAAGVLIQSVLPHVRASLPRARAIVAGRQPGPGLCTLAQSNPAVSLVADPPDMRPIFARATAVAVPLRAASGTRLKILQALAVGRPIVSTAIGVEGLELGMDVDLMVAPVVEPFGDALAHVLAHPARWAELVAAGRTTIQRHAWENYLPLLDTIYPDTL